MRTNSENHWSPFDPEWYKQAFDKFISTADNLFNQQDIIDAGYVLPDADRSKSSVFRNEAVLNNSFNEEKLRETLTDIYLNSSHKLIASNNDNVHFFQWNGTMNDVTFIANTKQCEIILPTETFINVNRDRFKRSQFYRKWISAADIINNWKVFRWNCMLFINQRPYSDFSLRIDEQQTTIRFTYQEFWKNKNYPIYIYKFDTNAQCRIKVSRRQITELWNWKIPVEYIDDQILNSDKMIAVFNRTTNDRSDEITTADAMSDNIEFLHVKDGYIDISNISEKNKDVIYSDAKEWILITLCVPKWFHEFPIPLPVDVLYRSYRGDFMRVKVNDNGTWYDTRATDDMNHVYISMDNNFGKYDESVPFDDAFTHVIRPIVLSDAFETQLDMYSELYKSIMMLSGLITKTADQIERFRFFMLDYTTDEKFISFCDELETNVNELHEKYNAFLSNKWMRKNDEFEDAFNSFIAEMPTVREKKNKYSGFSRQASKDNDFWAFISPLVWIPRELVHKYEVVSTLRQIDNKTLWETKLEGVDRFKHPINTTNFWTFEYDHDLDVWRPYVLDIERHFPDAYTLSDPNEETITPNRVFKAFFFYSDSMNVKNPSSDIYHSTPSWDSDMEAYEYEYGAAYRDIFIEKFYWMGIKTIYDGLIQTKYKWEVLEYVMNNDSYERFNNLFMSTMDPYFKMGLATYLRSSNYEFPFDDAITKMEESISTEFLGYKRITNYERYLDKTWIPSYFSYVTKILDDWDYSSRLIKRPRSTFDTKRVIPTLYDIQSDLNDSASELNSALDYIIEELNKDDYGLEFENIKTLRKLTAAIANNIDDVLIFINSIDDDIFSVDDVNQLISMLEKHNELIKNINDLFKEICDDATIKAKYNIKYEIALKIQSYINNDLKEAIDNVVAANTKFDIEKFMKAANDPEYLDEIRDPMKDRSLIGLIDRFRTPWPDEIKAIRNKLYTSTADFYSLFDNKESMNDDQIASLYTKANNIETMVTLLRDKVNDWWTSKKLDVDDALVDSMDDVYEQIHGYVEMLTNYINLRNIYIDKVDELRMILVDLAQYVVSDNENKNIDIIDNDLTLLLECVSYVTGTNDNVDKYYNEITSVAERELTFIEHEKSIYELIFEISNDENQFYITMTKYTEILNAIITYMNTVNNSYIPDSQVPTYSIVYKPTKIELMTGGFNHSVGDIVYIPKVGVYKILEVGGNIATCISLIDMEYRNTSFRDPTWRSDSVYDSITSGDGAGITSGKGMGITVKATKSEEIKIINDNVVSSYNKRISNILYLTNRDMYILNPYSNFAINNIIYNINGISDDWTKITSFYNDYMSNTLKKHVESLIESLDNLKINLASLIDAKNDNDLQGLLQLINKYVEYSYEYCSKNNKLSPTFIYFYNRMKVVYNNADDFYGNGTAWDGEDECKELLETLTKELELFKRKGLEGITDDTLYTMHDDCINKINTFSNGIDTCKELQGITENICENIENELNANIALQVDEWYNLNSCTVANGGSGYSVGDIVQIIPELPTDVSGNPIHDNEEVIMNDKVFIQITQVNDNGAAVVVQPLIDYAIPYQLWGSRNTITCVGSGEGLVINGYAKEITIADSTLFLDDTSDKTKPDQFDENDMFTFKFENIHDLDISYEVFLGGKQLYDFVVRHEDDTNQLHPRKIDVIYLNANDVYNLTNSSVTTQSEHYLVYKLEDVNVVSSGAGYEKGQEIIVDADQVALHLKVSELTEGPLKGIQNVEFIDDYIKFNDADPTSHNAKVVDDSANNIDDEYNNGYYDQLTKDGIHKGASRVLDPDKYPYVSRRFDDIEGGNRNSSYLYSDVDFPSSVDAAENGDPDYGFYLGSRIDENHKWNGIMNIQPPTDGVIPFDYRTPSGDNLPINGEYQEIARERICTVPLDPKYTKIETSTCDLEIIKCLLYIDENDLICVSPSDEVKYFNYSRDTGILKIVLANDERIQAWIDDGNLMVKPYGFVDMILESSYQIPKTVDEWPDVNVGSCFIVEKDETKSNHRTLYRVRTFIVSGGIIYEEPEIIDNEWKYFDIDWMKTNYYPDLPSLKAQYPDADWYNASTYRKVENEIADGKVEQVVTPIKYQGTYITDLSVDDLSVWNESTKQWENLHDESLWKLDVRNNADTNDYGFRLTYLGTGSYSYDMRLYLNKVPATQTKNAALKENAILDIQATVCDEVDKPSLNTIVNTGRKLIIRKLFPYEQHQSYIVNSDNPNMNFKLANYIHYKNEIHLEDLIIYNKTAGRYEDVLDSSMFEVRFKDARAVSKGKEKQTQIVRCIISEAGTSFVDGTVWCYNEEYKTHVFAHATSDFFNDGHLLTITPLHFHNAPSEDISLEFKVYQIDTLTSIQQALAVIEFQTREVEVQGDGYIHNVINQLAPLSNEIMIIPQYEFDGDIEYEVSISKSAKSWTFIRNKWEMFPKFHLDNYRVPADRIYIMTDSGRMPLVNPSTGKPSMQISYTDDGTDITFLSLYQKYDHLEVHTTPYPMRSVYTQRRVPENGYIDLKGRINKPLNKKYFEFWMNGRLLSDEVTIISPTKLFLHGLKSLRNFEIVEINRDPNEYFSDIFLDVATNVYGNPYPMWNFTTYLDAALSGTLDGDNYTLAEQEALLNPVWKQVDRTDDAYKDYPINQDLENDILLRVDEYQDVEETTSMPYQFSVVDLPTIEGVTITGRSLNWEQFGFIPIDEQIIIDMLNEEWKDEISSGESSKYEVVSDADWYGLAVRLYDEYGVLVHTLNESAYHIIDNNILKINTENKVGRITRTEVEYDLS